jgi:hypothetical protein
MNKISIFVPITKPRERQDPWLESISNFTEFADEVVIVCGDKSDLELDFPNKEKIKLIYNEWRHDDYMMYGEQYQKGFEATTSDWAIKADIDYLFHEDDWEDIRNFLEETKEDVLFMPKKQLILVDRYRVKAMMPIVFRGNLRGRVTFDSGGDYTWPRLDGELVKDKDKAICKKEYVIVSDNVTRGQVEERLPDLVRDGDTTYCFNRRISVWNFDFSFKSEEVIKREFLKQSKARKLKGESDWGQTEEEAFNYLINMQLGRINKGGWSKISVESLPKHIQNKVKNITPNQLGYNLFGRFDINKQS